MISYVGIGLEKCSNYLTGFELTLFVYDILNLDLINTHHEDYLTEHALTLLNTGLGLFLVIYT